MDRFFLGVRVLRTDGDGQAATCIISVRVVIPSHSLEWEDRLTTMVGMSVEGFDLRTGRWAKKNPHTDALLRVYGLPGMWYGAAQRLLLGPQQRVAGQVVVSLGRHFCC
jgi:hypothetical protein